jgi:class 3 adenylate cyclase
MDVPEMHYAKTADGVYLAYQIAGDGPVDLVWQPDWPGNIDMEWEFSSTRSLLTTLASFSRLILHDHRGIGLSSRNVSIPNLETRVADLLCVLDTVGSNRPVVVGGMASGAANALLAATRPERVAALVWLEPIARTSWAPDNPWGRTADELSEQLSNLRLWGTTSYARAFANEQATIGNTIPDSDADLYAKASRNACTPDVAIDLQTMWAETDVRSVLSAIPVPALCIAQTDLGAADRARGAAALIPGAELKEVAGPPWTSVTSVAIAEEIRRFVGAERPRIELDAILSTVLFTDIVGSTSSQARLGDHGWKTLLEQHFAIVRQALERWRGVENDTVGDGVYATFDGPARAIHCALEIERRTREMGVEVRAGIHTGECEIIDGKIGGITVSIGARVAALAGPSEVLVSQTVKDLVAGSGLAFEDAGEHELKGIPGSWRVHRVTPT